MKLFRNLVLLIMTAATLALLPGCSDDSAGPEPSTFTDIIDFGGV